MELIERIGQRINSLVREDDSFREYVRSFDIPELEESMDEGSISPF